MISGATPDAARVFCTSRAFAMSSLDSLHEIKIATAVTGDEELSYFIPFRQLITISGSQLSKHVLSLYFTMLGLVTFAEGAYITCGDY